MTKDVSRGRPNEYAYNKMSIRALMVKEKRKKQDNENKVKRNRNIDITFFHVRKHSLTE